MSKLLINTGSNVLLMFMRLVITFIITPITVHALGNYDYGIWEIVMAVVGYAGMLDLGLTPTISRFTAKFNAENDRPGLERLLATGTVALGAVGSIVLVVFVAWAMLKPEWLSQDGAHSGRYAIFLLLIGAQTAIAFPGHVAEAALEGMQRYSTKNLITIFNQIVGAIVTYLYITPENALLFLALANGIGSTIKYVVFYLMLRYPAEQRLHIRLRDYSRDTMRQIVGFGAKSFVQGASGNIEANTPVMIIGWIIGPAAVVFYRLPVALISQLRMLSWTLTHAFMPMFSDLVARGNSTEAQSLYLRASKFMLAILLPAAIMAGLLGADFISVWMGKEYGANAGPLVWMVLVFYMLPSIDPLSSRYLTAVGKHGIFARLYPIQAVANLAVSIPLGYAFGLLGIAAGSILPTAVVTPMVLRMVCRELGFTFSQYLWRVLVPALAPLAMMVATVLIAKRLLGGMHGYGALACAALGGGFAYLATYVAIGLTREERRLIISYLQWPRPRGALPR
jgi:O-antigen/teichoic acid export membrane protein